MVLHHALHIQVFNGDRLVVTYQLSREFVKEIFAGINNLGVKFGDFQPSLMPVIGTFLLSRQRLLRSFQSFMLDFKRLGVGDLRSVACHDQAGDAEVYANFFGDGRQWLNLGID